MQGYQLAQQFFGLLHLNLDDSLLVILSTSFHFSSVRGQDQQDEEDKLEDTINYVGLQIDFILGDEEEILVNHSHVEYELNAEKDAERNRSRDYDNGLVNAQGHFLSRSHEEVLEAWSIQNEDKH